MIKPIFYFVACLVFITACNQDPVNKPNTPAQNTPGVSGQNGVVVEQYNNISKDEADKIIAERAKEKAAERAQNLPGFRAHAKELVKERSQTEKAMAFLTSDHWAYEFVFSGTEMSKTGEYAGQWIKFGDDHTYEYGRYNEVSGSGQYHYSLNSEKMIMVDDKDDMMPEEWEIKAQDEVMIMVGAGYFGNNPRQCKMLRWNGRPVQPAG